MNFINSTIRKQTLLSSIIPVLFLCFLLFTTWNYPFKDIFFPKHMTCLSDLEGEYTSRHDYVNLTDITLYYTGYDSMTNIKLKGRYYYAFENDQCFFFLLEPQTVADAPDSISFDSLNLRLSTVNQEFSSFLANLSTDIDWSTAHLEEASKTFLASQYQSTLVFSYVFAVILITMCLYTFIVIFTNIAILIYPFLKKGMLPCSGFQAKKKLFLYMMTKIKKEENELIHIHFSSRGKKDFFVTPSFLFYFSTYETHIIPVKDIIWIYTHAPKPAHGISEACSLYTIHFILNNQRHVQFKGCPEKNSNALIALVAGKNPDILIGYSEEHKTLAKQYLAMHTLTVK